VSRSGDRRADGGVHLHGGLGRDGAVGTDASRCRRRSRDRESSRSAMRTVSFGLHHRRTDRQKPPRL
jgi:hypothetical protein